MTEVAVEHSAMTDVGVDDQPSSSVMSIDTSMSGYKPSDAVDWGQQPKMFVPTNVIMNMEYPDSTILREILDSPGPFQNDEEETICQQLIDELTDEEVEIAARTSYAYWAWMQQPSVSTDEDGAAFTIQARRRMAVREARRHFVGEGRHYKKALDRLRDVLSIRKAKNIDLVRCCFFAKASSSSGDDKEESRDDSPEDLFSRMRRLISEEYERQPMLVRGQDRDNRSIAIRMKRTTATTTDEAHALASLYMTEKALACTEIRTRGQQERTLNIFNFAGYSPLSAPRTSAAKTTYLMQWLYPERLFRVYVLDAPFVVRALYSLLKPFMSEETKSKTIFLSGDKEKEDVLGPLVDPDQAMPFMLKNGQLSTEIDLNYQFYHLPFHSLYNK